MPVRIRLSRGGAKKRPFYRIVIADTRRARDGKFIDQIGTYNPMLPKDSPDRVKIDLEKTKDWMLKGAQPSDRVTLFLSNLGVVEKLGHVGQLVLIVGMFVGRLGILLLLSALLEAVNRDRLHLRNRIGYPREDLYV